jgi:inosine-uridine nucleoside N-ribohydrolase
LLNCSLKEKDYLFSWIPDSVDCSIKNTAEWNIYVDPIAADIVFKSGIELEIYPL